MAEQHDYYRVLRAFEGERPFTAGEVVDGTDWRWARHLVERRYLAPASAPEPEQREPEQAEPATAGRRTAQREP